MNVTELPKVYQPAEVEAKWYPLWENSGLFRADVNPDKKPYCIVIPPPNITGSLHMGHALNNTIQDILIRTHRMRGFETLWLPGTDHAGIATQAVVEKELKKEGKTRHQLGRDAFLERVWAWREESGRTIVGQLKRLGASCDWSRERFTMDPECTLAVRVAFGHLFRKGYIYRGKRIVNWCTRCLTALSDLEVEHTQDKNGKIYHLRYGLESGGHVVIATTRPETILADVAIAVHPEDERYKALVGTNAILPLVERKLKIIADPIVEREFGTGALKVTPAHDANDYEIGQRHGLESLVCMDLHGIINDLVGAYQGLERFECRKKIMEDLRAADAVEKEEDYEVALARCYRCDTVLEPYLSDQWYVNMEKLGKPALDVVKDGKIDFYPERFKGLYINWMENLRDWCISRQLWWGHRVPVWTCGNCGHQDAHVDLPERCPKCDSVEYHQETDVLDTWFSSALWPLSTLGWPADTPDLAYFYPTSVLSTARDILYLWVARMIMMGLEFKHEIPYRDVYVHATVLARDGRRMSKSLGTGVDPLELFDKFGTDATRFGLAWMTGQGQDIRYSEERIEMSRNFANKIWNAFRLIQKFLPEKHFQDIPGERELWRLEDAWILDRLQRSITTVTEAIARYAFDEAARELYEFFWDDFCDWYLELVKPVFYERKDIHEQQKTGIILDYVFSTFLRLLHPIMPFITEEIWHAMPGDRGFIMVAAWPQPFDALREGRVEQNFALLQEVIRGIRNMRAEVSIPPKDDVAVTVVFHDLAPREVLAENEDAIRRLAGATPITIIDSLEDKPKAALSARVGGGELFMPLAGAIDLGKEIARLEKELQDVAQNIERTRTKLSKPDFVERAKPEVVERERARLEELAAHRMKVSDRLGALKELSV